MGEVLQMDVKKNYLERINRLKNRVLNTYPEIDLENAVILTRGFQESEGEPLVIQKAYAFRKQCMEKNITIWDDELLVGNAGSKQRGGLLCPDASWTYLDKEIDTINTRKYDPFHLKEEDKKAFLEIIKPYWQGRSIYEKWCRQIPEKTKILRDCGSLYIDRKAVRGWGEVTGGYDIIINEGVEGIEKRIAKVRDSLDITKPGHYEKLVYLKALSYSADGLRQLGKRYAAEAKRLAGLEENAVRKQELLDIAEVCDRVPEKPARTFREALQSLYFYQISIFMEQNAASYNPGRMDQYLYPYYKADLEAGCITPDEAQELLDCMWVKFSEQCLLQDGVTARYSAGYPMFQNVCVGGVDKNGMDAVNDLSYMILQATKEVQMYQPSLSVKYNLARNSNEFITKIVELIQEGTGFPAFHSDEAGILMMLNKGVPMPEAYDWNPCGCVETSLSGRMRCYTSFADYNMGSAVEYALNDGKSRKYDTYAGARTGNPLEFKTYEQFLEAIKTQIKYMLHAMVAGSHVMEEVVREMVCPTLSLSFPECIENASDYAWGGAKYNIGNGLDAIGVADLINSIIAVKELVYDKKIVTMELLVKAIENNFVGYEDVLHHCLSATKYGNVNEETNSLARELLNYIVDYIETFSSKYGKMTAGILPVSGNTPFGLEVGALPSGQRAGAPLADGISPNVGTDTEGMSAIINTCANIPHGRFSQGTLLNLKLDPDFARGEGSVKSLVAFLKSLCARGVFHAQFNVINHDTLLEAQQYPDKHKGLLIRVAGYTAFFTELGPETQKDIMSRTVQKTM